MSILFINGSAHKDGATAKLAAELLRNKSYDTLNLGDYRIYDYGQNFADDQFDEALARALAAETLVMGSPCYWQNISGLLRCYLDRHYDAPAAAQLAGKRLAFVFQGEGPEPWIIEDAEYTMKRFAKVCGMEFLGTATNAEDARDLAKLI